MDRNDAFLDRVEADLLVDYAAPVAEVLGRNDSLECLFEVPSTSPREGHSAPNQARGDAVGMGDFRMVRVIGMGASSRVVQVSNRDNGQMYAIKIMSKHMLMQDEKTVERIVTEKRILSKLSHPFVVSLHWAFQTDGHLFMVLDYCAGGELFYHFDRVGAFSEPDARFYASEILLGLGYLHQQGILYRDLKLENCLLDIDGHVRLTDFGLSRDGVSEAELCESHVGTWTYISPEMIRREGHGFPLDFYCLGCLLHLLLTEKVPHETSNPRSMYMRRRNGSTLLMPTGFSEEVCDLLAQLLDSLPSQRLCRADAAQKHPWFQGVDFARVLQKLPQPAFPTFPPINPAAHEGGNFDSSLGYDLSQSFCNEPRDSGAIAGFSKMDSGFSNC